MKFFLFFLAANLTLVGCSQGKRSPSPASDTPILSAKDSAKATLDDTGAQFTKLALALGERDADYVDAYHGPAGWREQAKSQATSLEHLRKQANELLQILQNVTPVDHESKLRQTFQARQLRALITRVDMLTGKQLPFDAESKALYDAVAPRHDDAFFANIAAQLDKALPPGPESIGLRFTAFREKFAIAPDKLDVVFRRAIAATRERTRNHIALPPEETFTIEYVRDKPWGGYNWYEGNYRSKIQVNTDLPIYVDRVLDLAGHEGYPGHHVFNVLREKNLVRDRGWIEFTVYPLFSPQALIAEGSANYGLEVVFPKNERIAWEKENLFPLAGLSTELADVYYHVLSLQEKLAYADNEAARRYLDGEFNAEQTAAWLVKFALMPPDRAQRRVDFIKRYRSYVINYNLGKDLVQSHVEAVNSQGDVEKRWQVFAELLSSPILPSDLHTSKK